MTSPLRHWKLKAAIQKTLSILPGGMYLNTRLQRFAGLRDFEANVRSKFADWRQMMEYIRAAGGKVENATMVEIGTGWYPALPVLFYLAGARRIYSFDVNRHLNLGMTCHMFAVLAGLAPEIAAATGKPANEIVDRLAGLKAAQGGERQLLSACSIEYRVQDFRESGLPGQSADIVYSNSVLEHVPAGDIPGILSEARRLLRPGGVTVHAIGINDHYAFLDRRVSFVNFLQYPQKTWDRWYNNDLLYQNRLRGVQILRMVEQAGFQVVQHWPAERPGVREALATMEVAPEFRSMTTDELAKTSCDFAAIPRS